MNSSLRRTRRYWIAVLAMAVLSYAVLLGGTATGEIHPWLRVINAIIGGVLVVTYLLRAPSRADRVDRAVLVAVLLIAAAALLSHYPRQSFDAVLAALAFAAALFVARDILSGSAGRALLRANLIVLSGIFTLLASTNWLPLVVEWWALNDMQVIPPLNLNLHAAPWGHRHDLALLIVMLYPSWWLGRPSPARATVAFFVGALNVAVVIVDGSRNLWLAIAVASAVLVAPFARRLWNSDVQARRLVVGGAIGVAGTLIATGFASAVLERLLNLTTLGARSAMWVPLTNAWLTSPISGFGPGSFPWVLQETPYFETNSWAPRHPDSVLFQLLPEAGLLGVAAVVLVVFATLPRLLRTEPAARWALIVFAACGIGANPTDFGFLIAVAVAWTAYALPHRLQGSEHTLAVRLRRPTIGAFGVVAAAYALTLVAAFFHESGRDAIADGDLNSAGRQLATSVATDPGMALYSRELGTLELRRGEWDAAAGHLRAAVAMNASDDLAWRTLALTEQARGNGDQAGAALQNALNANRADPANLLLMSRWRQGRGDVEAATELLAEVAQAWPAIVAAPGFSAMLPSGLSAQTVVDAALRRWQNGDPAPSSDLLLLAVLSNSEELYGDAARLTGLPESLVHAVALTYMCHGSASRVLESVPDSDKRSDVYWQARVRESSRLGLADVQAIRLLSIMSGSGPAVETTAMLNPHDRNGNFGKYADIWGYRRAAISWPGSDIQLPSPSTGSTRWLVDVAGAVRAAGLEDRLSDCG